MEKTHETAKKTKPVLTGAQVVIESLKKEGVEHIFGYPGAIILPIYDEIYHCKEITHYLVRHEQAAVHAAEGYARVTGKPGVALVTSGPGACNTVTAIANAYYDAYPLVVITGQVDSNLIGNDAFQEADVVGITRSCCKHNYLVKDIKKLPSIIKEAFHIASTGKPGPVVIDIPKDVIDAKVAFEYPEQLHLPGYKPKYSGHTIQNNKALSLIYNAKRPVILAGGGIIHSNAHNELFKLAHELNIPITTTLMGIGAFPSDDELSLGMIGMFGTHWSNKAVAECDVLFAIGTRFSDRVTGELSKFCQKAKIIHIDIDPCSISKNVPVNTPIVGDAKIILSDMLEHIDKEQVQKNINYKTLWLQQIKEWENTPVPTTCLPDGICPQTAIQAIHDISKEHDAFITTEVGQHQMWTARLQKFNKPRKFLTSGGLGTMGFGFPAAIGAQIAAPDKLVVGIAGDGSIQMNIQELATCVEYKLPVKICIINNGCLGMVRQIQEKMFNENYSETFLTSPDYVKLAEAYGAIGYKVTEENELESTLRTAFDCEGPAVIEIIVNTYKTIYPWVTPEKLNCKLLQSNYED
ncbi:MAG: biosynthetic-type acetolactate synthase large subunit [bacterium]